MKIEVKLKQNTYFACTSDHEPIHVHVSNGSAEARFKVEPITLIENHELTTRELRYAEAAIEENKTVIIKRWNYVFKNEL